MSIFLACILLGSWFFPLTLFVLQSLDNLRSAEEVRSKRHSTSELGNISYSDVRREGWLHFKQILTEKGKVRKSDWVSKCFPF